MNAGGSIKEPPGAPVIGLGRYNTFLVHVGSSEPRTEKSPETEQLTVEKALHLVHSSRHWQEHRDFRGPDGGCFRVSCMMRS